MYEEVYVLDNTSSGIAAFKPGTDEIIKLGKSRKELFRNKNLLETELYRSGIKDYDIGFILDGNFVPYSKVQKISYDQFQAIIDGKIVDIIPTYREKLLRAGYFSFTEDPDTMMNYTEGRELNKCLYRYVKTSAAHLFKNGVFKTSTIDTSLCNLGPTIGPMKYEVYDNTTTLRIMRGFELVKINEFRKSIGDNVLPFVKSKDKYKNIYFCFTRDENENFDQKYEKYQETSEAVLDKMLQYIKDNYHIEGLNPHINIVNFYYQIQL